MKIIHGDYELDDALARMDLGRCHQWLTDAYWSPGIERELVERGFSSSALVVGTYHAGTQVGCLRLVSDRTRIAYLMDVFVAAEHRGKGLGRAMVRFALDHPDLSQVSVWMLATRDAHGVYASLGFSAPEHPEYQMRLERPRRPS